MPAHPGLKVCSGLGLDFLGVEECSLRYKRRAEKPSSTMAKGHGSGMAEAFKAI
jgi:hypothetical protein